MVDALQAAHAGVLLNIVTRPLATLVRFAARHQVQGYDAVYLGLALHLAARLATLNGGLRTATKAAGVAVV